MEKKYQVALLISLAVCLLALIVLDGYDKYRKHVDADSVMLQLLETPPIVGKKNKYHPDIAVIVNGKVYEFKNACSGASL